MMPEKKFFFCLVMFLAMLVLIFCTPQRLYASEGDSDIDIPFTKFVLDNGLTLVVHEDHKAPIVAVNVWYHVGSKNERVGKTGFAHLFEHLMFNGSENYDDEYFIPLERVGATTLNGTTNHDRTNYFQNVPTHAFDLVLWMESDRMGHLLDAINQDKLDEQRGVVQNEKRQGKNSPYGDIFNLITENTFPAGHPYSWSVIGSMEDLSAANLDDVNAWFKEYYGAANAVLSIAGDVDTEEVKAKVEMYFGDIPSGPPVTKHQVWIAKRNEKRRHIVQDRVPQSRLLMVWNIPQWGSQASDELSLGSDILAKGKTSRLYKRLVYQDQMVSEVKASVDAREIAGLFIIDAMIIPGKKLSDVEAIINEELKRFLKNGPTQEELDLVKIQYEAKFIRGIEAIGGFGGKSDILATNEVYGGRPDYFKTTFEHIRQATTESLKETTKQWLDDGVYIMEVHPFAEYQTHMSSVDRSKLPEVSPVPKAKFPDLQRTTLSNGLNVILAQRHSVPLVSFEMMFHSGFSVDQLLIEGMTRLTMDMLDEGTQKHSALQISEGLAALGAELSIVTEVNLSRVSLSALKANVEASLDILSDVILNPSFRQEDFDRLQKEQLVRIQQEMSGPGGIVDRLLGRLVFGREHPYGVYFTGSGDETSVSKLLPKDLKEYHQTWIRPNNATLTIVGDTTLEEIKPKLETCFKDWKKAPVPSQEIMMVQRPKKSLVYLVDRPGAEQSVIAAVQLIAPRNSPDDLATQMLVNILGGTFTSRINMNLREDKHWSYGAFSEIFQTQKQRPLLTSAGVQTDKTKESIQEMLKEYQQIISSSPPTQDELAKVVDKSILGLSGHWEALDAVSYSISEMVRYNLPDDYYQNYGDNLRKLRVSDLIASASKNIDPDRLVWLVVGDLEKIEEGVRGLNLGDVHVIDANGQIIR